MGRDEEAASLRILALAQEVFGEVGQRRPRQRRKRQRADDVDGGEPQPRGQEPIEKTFAEPE